MRLRLLHFFFISCSQNTPELYSADYSVIFDYKDEETPPSARLSVFASSGSDVHRYERIKITSLDSGYVWETDSFSRLQTDDLQYAGCTNIVAPVDEKLPMGKYQLTYINADEKEYTLTLDVKYDADFYDVLLPALPEVTAKKLCYEDIAIYDKNHVLLYFGEKKAELKTSRDIWNNYREAATYQLIWYTRNSNVICIAPEKEVSPEADQAQN